MGAQIAFVCSDHFLPEDYETNRSILRTLGIDTKNARLKRDAVPTQNLPLGASPKKRRRSELRRTSRGMAPLNHTPRLPTRALKAGRSYWQLSLLELVPGSYSDP
ncbi:hypothetical protein HPB52_013379 [Rhipicephalus sanguineus]|uniref:THAP-type domain-containing protein n=1 Tax=Rhipicephalus sanguineus TaxID=34632 RepID=A0A9D4Q2F0_RHISA|nr:hypothetical protein HPB52_013379 [Rhipicephalus sanguineus]